MRVYVPPGAAHRGARLIVRRLNDLHSSTGVRWVRTDEDVTQNALAARSWAETHGVPITGSGLPDTVLLTRDLTRSRLPEWEESEDMWHRLHHEEPLWMTTALALFRDLTGQTRSVVWLNTGADDAV